MDEEWKQWKFAGIYGIKHIEDGKIYVGQSINIARRIYCHQKYQYDGCTYLSNAIGKYGWNAFEIVLLESVDDFSQLDVKEQFFIDTLQACNPQYGYNICLTVGSNKGRKLSKEHKARIGIAGKGRVCSEETRDKIRVTMQGRVYSTERVEKMAATKRGKHHSEETKAKIRATSSNFSTEARTKMSIAHKGKPLTDEHKAKLKESKHKVVHFDERTAILLDYLTVNPKAKYTEIKSATGICRESVLNMAKCANWHKNIDGYWGPILGYYYATDNYNCTINNA